MPAAVAILNPKQADCPYPYKDLCGCGVGFKLISALSERLGISEDVRYSYLDLVATAIAADIVPMTGENRILAYHGLRQINEKPSAGIAALIRKTGISKMMDIGNVVFMIAPRVNAAGRMDDAKKAVQLFIEKDPEKADAFAAMLHSDNDDRKQADSSITIEALEILKNDPGIDSRKSTVVFKQTWHKGVVGIVASRLIEHYYRPTIVLTQSDGLVTGSARSVPGFNLYEAIYACKEHLTAYGGHFAAAGLSMLPENVDRFSAQFEEVVSNSIEAHMLIPEIIIDAVINFNDISYPILKIIDQMEPFGPDNPKPIFMATGLRNVGSRIVKEQHLRFELRQGNTQFNGIGFNLAHRLPIVQAGQPLDLAFRIEENHFNNQKQLQLKVVDVRLSA